MASVWIRKRARKRGGFSFRVEYRPGGRDAGVRFAGAFATMKAAKVRRDYVLTELAAGRMPDVRAAVREAKLALTFAEAGKRFQAARVDVSEATRTQHRILRRERWGRSPHRDYSGMSGGRNPLWSPHDLRHRRTSLLHLRGVPWARIAEFVGQSDLADTPRTPTGTFSPTRRARLREIGVEIARTRSSGAVPVLSPDTLYPLFPGVF